MKVFITGNRGFMGSHLSHYLTTLGHEIVGIDNDFHSCDLEPTGINSFGDIRNVHDIESGIQWADVVIHLAAQIHVDYSIKHPAETIDINVQGTLNVLECCRKYQKKCIVASTSEAYGSAQSYYMDEKHPLDCQSPYGASKVAADRLAKSYIDTYNMDVIIIRNFNAFGPHQNDGSYGSVIARFAKAAFDNQPLFIYGDGTQERDYMYIDDIIQAYDFAIHKCPPGVYNFGTGIAWSIDDVARYIIEFTGSKSQIINIEPRAGEVRRLCCDITKVKSLGFKPITNFCEDLKKYLSWYKGHNHE